MSIPTTTMTPHLSMLLQLAERVAGLNPEAGEIGPGMLATIVEEARHALTVKVSATSAQQRFERLKELTAPNGPSPNVAEILGMLSFSTSPIARALRLGGRDIAQKPEAEQAATLHFLLGMYVEHGTDWWLKARAELAAMGQGTRARAIAEARSA